MFELDFAPCHYLRLGEGLLAAGGALVFAALFLIWAVFCFCTLEGLKFSTYVIPYALIQYYPLQYLLGRSDNPFYALCPLGAGLFLLAAYAFWRLGLRRYTSTGS